MAAFFSSDFISFFQDLYLNNHTLWFQQNKKRYEKSVKIPFQTLVADLIAHGAQQHSYFLIEPKDAIMRINRDIRFSKDKTPYNTHVSAIISPVGKKDKSIPGLYIELSHQGISIYGGVYMPDKHHIYRIRTYIIQHAAAFKKLYKSPNFNKLFGEIQGEKNKKLEVEFQPLLKTEPLIANKQFFWKAELPASWITSPELFQKITEYQNAMFPLNRFFMQAMTE